MKTFVGLLAVLLCGSLVHAGVVEEAVVLTKADIAQKREILPWGSVWRIDGKIILRLSLHEAYSTPGRFARYTLRVLHKPLEAQNLSQNYFDQKLIQRSETSTSKSATFVIRADEVDYAYIVISSWSRDPNGMAKMTSECVPLSMLVSMIKPIRIETPPDYLSPALEAPLG